MRINFFFYLFFSFLFIIIQTSIVPTSYLGRFSPDLNLIIIIYLVVRPQIPYMFTLVALNGFLMDVFSASPSGLHTITRFAAFIALRAGIRNLDYNSDQPTFPFLALFAGTLLTHLLLLGFLMFWQDGGQTVFMSVELALFQAIINTAVGVPIIMLLKKLDGTFKT
ncbi:MAG: hypothetical protein OXF23_01720 [Candidatus Dadabacteria bacterium]|nr:hypothetical protein [Candidatus Dadabacteria bacterium]MCY4262389.1 hypothetical protein [Candidatus Dadabacteria bacterium]